MFIISTFPQVDGNIHVAVICVRSELERRVD